MILIIYLRYSACDLVLTTPNVTVGLAGSLNIKTILLLPKGGLRWRWGLPQAMMVDLLIVILKQCPCFRAEVIWRLTMPLSLLSETITHYLN